MCPDSAGQVNTQEFCPVETTRVLGFKHVLLTEYPEVDGTHEDHWVQPSVPHRATQTYVQQQHSASDGTEIRGAIPPCNLWARVDFKKAPGLALSRHCVVPVTSMSRPWKAALWGAPSCLEAAARDPGTKGGLLLCKLQIQGDIHFRIQVLIFACLISFSSSFLILEHLAPTHSSWADVLKIK